MDNKKGERKLSFRAGLLLFFGIFLAILDGITALVSCILLSIGRTFRWEMLLLAAGCLATALLAWLLIRAGLKRNRLLTELRRYGRLLAGDPSGDVRRMAQLMGKTREQAEEELAKLIQMKCFPQGVYLEEGSGRLRRPPSIAARLAEASRPAAALPAEPAKPEEFVIVVCSQCGAVNRVPKGKTIQCQGAGCKAQLVGQPPQEKADILSRL